MIKQFDLVQKTKLAEYERVGLSLVADGYVRFHASCFFTAKAADFVHDNSLPVLTGSLRVFFRLVRFPF